MKNIILSILILSTVSKAGVCWKIKDNDLRRHCESLVEGRKNCWLIKDIDKKNYCEAIVYHKKTCWKIKDNDRREFCKVLTGQ